MNKVGYRATWTSGLGRLAWALAALVLVCCGAQARQVLDLDASHEPVFLSDWGDWWLDRDGSATVDQAADRRKPYAPMTAGQRLPVAPGQALWIRFTVPPAPDEERWFLRLPNAGLDRATLYTRGMDDRWSEQVAGDRVPVVEWTLPHLHPLFALSVSAADPTYYLLRIEASNSFSTPILFETESRLNFGQQRASLLHGLYFGLIGMVLIFALVSALLMRDLAYASFSAFVLTMALAVASATGVAGLHLWNASPVWTDSAEYTLPTLAFVPLLLFISQAVSMRSRSPAIDLSLIGSALIALSAAVATMMLPSPARMHIALACALVMSGVGIAALGWGWRRGDRFARWILGAFAPILLALPFPAARALDWTGVNFASQHAMQIAVAISLPALLALLVMRSQERRDYRSRITQLDHADPLTGLVNDRVFAHRLRGLIERSTRFEHCGAVLLLDLTNLGQIRDEFGRRVAIEVLVRLGGRLATMARDVDTVGRLGETRFGMLIEGPVPPERLASFASKVLARCILPFNRLPSGLVARPKLALVLVPRHAANPDEALARLDAMLLEASPDYRRSIFIPDSALEVQAVTQPGAL